MLIPSGAFYLDLVTEDPLTGSPTPILINAFPFDGQVQVPAADAGGSHELYLCVVDIGANTLAPGLTTITVTTTLGVVVVFNGAVFAAGWTSSTYAPVSSDGGANIDEHRFVLRRDTPFVSLEVISVTVHAETLAAENLDTTYSFTIEDLTKPLLLSAKTRGLAKVRALFNEPMLQVGDVAENTLFVRSLSAGLTVMPPNGLIPARLLSERATFTAADVGRFVGIAGAEEAINNDIFEILSLIDERTAEIDQPLVLQEVLPVGATVTISPYRLEGVVDAHRVIPFFEPVVIGAEAVSASEIELTLHAEITPNRLYRLHTALVEDLFANVIDASFVEFTTETCFTSADRADFNMLDFFPQGNLGIDASRDHERFLRVIDEVMQLLLCDIDAFPKILDIDQVPENLLDALLAHLGNPFTFAAALTSLEKRRLAKVLVPIYKRKGVESAIEATISFLLGFEADVQPYLDPDVTWTLGDPVLGVLGETTILGPGTSFLKYSFQVDAEDDLTETQRRRLIEIVEYMKPAHTHFIRLIEPSTPTIPVFAPPP